MLRVHRFSNGMAHIYLDLNYKVIFKRDRCTIVLQRVKQRMYHNDNPVLKSVFSRNIREKIIKIFNLLFDIYARLKKYVLPQYIECACSY